MPPRTWLATACVLALVTLAAGSARAQPDAGQDPEKPDSDAADAERPWVRGVSLADRREAQRLFVEGVALMQKTLFAQAADKYEQALSHWDLPAIHYNLAIARFNLAQDLAAYRSAERALRHGAAALGADKYRDAEQLKAQLENRLARVTVSCDQPGARVSLDGALLFTGAGREFALVTPGEHQVTAEKPGFYPELVTLAVSAGDHERISIELVSAEPITVRRWACAATAFDTSVWNSATAAAWTPPRATRTARSRCAATARSTPSPRNARRTPTAQQRVLAVYVVS